MHIDHLRDFLALADTASFSSAAAARHTSQPNFSKRIKALEAWFGEALIDRRARPVALTLAGRAFLPKARAAVDDLLAARAPKKTAYGGIAGATLDVQIALPHSASLQLFPMIKQRLRAVEPRAVFSMRIANHDAVAAMLEQSRCDLALAYRCDGVPIAGMFEVSKAIIVGADALIAVSPPMGDRAWSLAVPHRDTYLGRIWRRFGQPTKGAIEMGLPADLRAGCLTGAHAAIVPKSLVAGDLATGALIKLPGHRLIPYGVQLYCAAQASGAVRTMWQNVGVP